MASQGDALYGVICRVRVMSVTVRGYDDAVGFPVRVLPRASRDELGGARGEALKVRLMAPPVDGAVNGALIDLLAEALDVPRRAVRIISGETSRTKVVEIVGNAPANVERLADEHQP